MNQNAFKVAGLLYTPALNETIADKIINHKIPYLSSICFCLEDTIIDTALPKAYNQLMKTLEKLAGYPANLPLIFIRIRNPEHMVEVTKMLGGLMDIVTGFVLPKFDTSNSERYIENIKLININRKPKLCIMPILESFRVADCRSRQKELETLKNQLLEIKEIVLNIRMGGNDFCNLFGIRRNQNHTIYDMCVIRDIIADILNVFSADFVVSGIVWEYFGGENWEQYFKRELELDRLNGIVGKTAIHPCQLPIIRENLKVDKTDYENACNILGWNGKELAVSGENGRMNEVKCHTKWAYRIKCLGDIYGIR